MGDDLFWRYPGLTRFAATVLGYDLAALCRDDPDGVLGRTRYTQPALFVVNALHTFEREHQEQRRADYYLGHSLGEYNALLAAGAFDFETGLRLVAKRAELMDAASGGAMTAVMDTPERRLREIFAEHDVSGVDIAGYNTDQQLVIAATDEVLRAAHAALREHDVRFAPLRVSAPFHSRYMAPARAEFEEFLRGFTFDTPHTPVIANTTGRPHRPDGLVEALGRQLVSPVRWTDSVRHLLSADPDLEYEEIGGQAVQRMVTRIRQATPVATTESRE